MSPKKRTKVRRLQTHQQNRYVLRFVWTYHTCFPLSLGLIAACSARYAICLISHRENMVISLHLLHLLWDFLELVNIKNFNLGFVDEDKKHKLLHKSLLFLLICKQSCQTSSKYKCTIWTSVEITWDVSSLSYNY